MSGQAKGSGRRLVWMGRCLRLLLLLSCAVQGADFL